MCVCVFLVCMLNVCVCVCVCMRACLCAYEYMHACISILTANYSHAPYYQISGMDSLLSEAVKKQREDRVTELLSMPKHIKEVCA